MTKQGWNKRLSPPLKEAAAFNASVGFDKRLAEVDITASLAHAEMLAAQGIITKKDGAAIRRGLLQIRKEIKDGKFKWREEYEDVHLNIENRLTQIAGDAGRRLHTARSRNDQVATDIRLWLREESDALREELKQARRALLKQAEKHAAVLMPGMTHLQPAQPITFGHHLLAYDDMLARDIARLADARKRLNIMPLGSGALAGVGYPIDRARVAKALGFDGVSQNAADAVSARDFAIEFASSSAMIMSNFSRLCEEVVLWMSPAFGFVSLPDGLCAGSSIMPQKKNPDIAELMRGKTGRVFGALMSLLTMVKAQPLAYNKDNQEDKEPLFDAADTVRACARLFALMVSSLQVNETRMRAMLDLGYPTATELADELTRRGVPFRKSHEQVAAVVTYAQKSNKKLDDLTVKELSRFVKGADEKLKAALDPARAVAARNHEGGTSPLEVLRQVKLRRGGLAK